MPRNITLLCRFISTQRVLRVNKANTYRATSDRRGISLIQKQKFESFAKGKRFKRVP